MQFKELGRTGVLIPEVGLGTWDYRGDTGALRKGLECGALFIDTAESYGTEPLVGQLLREIRGQIHEKVFVASKVSARNFRRGDFQRSVEASLAKLGVDAIDLMQLHEPNPAIPIEETMHAVSRLIEAGKIRFCGVSNFSVEELQSAEKALGKYPVVSNQVRYNLIDRTIEKELLPYCQANGITVIAYSPLSKDLKRILDCDPDGALSQLSRQTGKTAAQIAINWCNCKDRVVSIPKSNSADRIAENCGASDWRLSTEQITLLNERIRFRYRNKVDLLVRKLMPRSLQKFAVAVRDALPRGLRRRLM